MSEVYPEYLVSARRGEICELREFIQPADPDVLAVYSQVGPGVWRALDFVCRNFSYRLDIGDLWLFPPETLARGRGDCEDTTFLFVSLAQNSDPGVWATIGSYRGYGHAWGAKDRVIYETTFTSARLVPDPQNYYPYVYFNKQAVVELWHGALSELLGVRRNEQAKLALMAELNG